MDKIMYSLLKEEHEYEDAVGISSSEPTSVMAVSYSPEKLEALIPDGEKADHFESLDPGPDKIIRYVFRPKDANMYRVYVIAPVKVI